MIKTPDVTLLYVIFSFIVAYAILKKFLFVPLAGILREREEEDRTSARVHAESLQELAKAVAEIEEKLAIARREALKEREAMRGEGRGQLEKKLAGARAAASEVLERANREIAAEAERSSAELPRRVGILARALAEKVLGRKLAA